MAELPDRSPNGSVITVDPSSGAEIERYEPFTDEDIDAVVSLTAAAGRSWAATTLNTRLSRLTSLAGELRTGHLKYSALISREMGKPLAEAAGEIEKAATTAEWYVEHAGAILADEPIDVGPTANAWVRREPIGVVLAVMPWNFPFWQVFRFAIPTLAAGNAVLLKHSPNVTGCALAVEAVLLAAGFPEGLVRTVVLDEPRVPSVIDRLIADDRIQAVTLTGSNRAGAAVGASAGRAVKKSVLELGGSDPFVVLADADIEIAAVAAVRARYANCGQSCVCAKRFIVATEILEAFTERFVAHAAALVVGHPAGPDTQLGPMARADLRSQLDRQVKASVAQGARLLLGGSPVDGPGFYYPATVLDRVEPGMTVFDEETFGPVAAITSADTDRGLSVLAGATQYGLAASIWSADPNRARAVADGFTSGAVFINAVVASDPRMPFGGTRRSGYGRELAAAGIREFTNERSYWIQHS